MNEITKLEEELQRAEDKGDARGLLYLSSLLIVFIVIVCYLYYIKNVQLEKTMKELREISSKYELVKEERDFLKKEITILKNKK